MKKKSVLLLVVLVTILVGIMIYIGVFNKIAKDDTTVMDVASNYLYDFLSKISYGDYQGAYKQLSEKSKNEKFPNVEDLATYCIRNFLTSTGSIRYSESDEGKEISENEYLINVTFGNESGKMFDSNLTEEEAEIQNVITYGFVVKLIDGDSNYTIELR